MFITKKAPLLRGLLLLVANAKGICYNIVINIAFPYVVG